MGKGENGKNEATGGLHAVSQKNEEKNEPLGIGKKVFLHPS